MAGFLRKKRQETPPPPPARAPSPPVTPLFSRFATSATADPSPQRVVSSPMTLASATRRDQAPRMVSGGGARGAVQHREDAKQPRYAAEPPYVQANIPGPSTSATASSSNANSYSYASPAQKRQSNPAGRTPTLPPAASSIPPSRRFSHAPGAEKPLPSISGQDNYPDPLGSNPPQSVLPANRRASARGMPPQASAAIQNFSSRRVMTAPIQQPHISAAAWSPNSPGPNLGTHTLPPAPSQTPSAAPDPTFAPFQNPSRYPKEYDRQDPRHKLSDADAASGGPPAISGPASPPRQGAPGRRAPDGRAPPATSASYQDPYATFNLPNSTSRESNQSNVPTPSLPPPIPQPDTDMGATISSFEVQSFHPNDSFKINSGLLPAQHTAAPKNNAKPKRTPSLLVKGKPLIFAAMETSPSEKEEYDPYRSQNYAYSSPPTDVVNMPRFLTGESEEAPDLGFSRSVLDTWDEQQQRPSDRQGTPQLNGTAPLPLANGGQLPHYNGTAHLPPQAQFAPRMQPQTPPRNHNKSTKSSSSMRSTSSTSLSAVSARSMTGSPPVPEPPHTPRTLTKPRSTTPRLRKESSASLHQPSSPAVSDKSPSRSPPSARSHTSTLMLDDDPFAKVEGVRMLKPASRDGPPPPPSSSSSTDNESSSPRTEFAVPEDPSTPRQEAEFDVDERQLINPTPPQKVADHAPPAPVTPQEYYNARTRRRGDQLEKAPPSSVAGIEVRETRMPGTFPLVMCITNPQLLGALLPYLSFHQWCILSAVTKATRMRLVQTPGLREVALERYLHTVGYSRWVWDDADPLELSLLVCLPFFCSVPGTD
ncbi:hypothetical protein B0H15DRAFT_457916 [Mycena belliarum]|uniref:Uncharacterized protein n=1 Tax=Mycena belliarum TaxID=1033014 RepID=A0AAD6UGI6_9AGAR|nr:hypothetical protein B0H15DRAFT_457916 [Mycena belliae]